MCAMSLCLGFTLLLPTVLGATCDIEHCMNCEFGPCTECVYGYYGYTCTEKCHGCWHGGCEKDTGRCIQCSPGHFTDTCNRSCPVNCRSGYDGNKYCDRVSGECLEGCEISKWGSQCQNTCNSNCGGFACEQSDGSCIEGCLDRWFGEQCDSPCPLNCRDQRCSLILGHCSEGCNPGFKGLKCDVSCENCIDDECSYNDLYQSLHCTKGCKDGWTSVDCKQKCSTSCRDRICYSNGTCRTCPDGYYGDGCLLLCPQECQACDRRGLCVGIPLPIVTMITMVTTSVSSSTILNSLLYLVVTAFGLQVNVV